MKRLLILILLLGFADAAHAQSHGIVYATGSKMVRRIISNASSFTKHVGPGESILVVQQEKAPNVFEAEAAVEAATGVKPASTAVAVVDSAGKINSIIKADPAIDAVPDATLIEVYATGITKEATYDAKTGLFTMPIVVIKAGAVLKDGTVVKEDIQSGGVIAKPDATIDALPIDALPIDGGGIVAKPPVLP